MTLLYRSLPLTFVLLAASSAALANGNMDGGSSGPSGPAPFSSGRGGGEIEFPAPPAPGDNQAAPVPDGPGLIPYPPSGPDRTTRLIDQINQIGKSSRERDRERASGEGQSGAGGTVADSGSSTSTATTFPVSAEREQIAVKTMYYLHGPAPPASGHGPDFSPGNPRRNSKGEVIGW